MWPVKFEAALRLWRILLTSRISHIASRIPHPEPARPMGPLFRGGVWLADKSNLTCKPSIFAHFSLTDLFVWVCGSTVRVNGSQVEEKAEVYPELHGPIYLFHNPQYMDIWIEYCYYGEGISWMYQEPGRRVEWILTCSISRYTSLTRRSTTYRKLFSTRLWGYPVVLQDVVVYIYLRLNNTLAATRTINWLKRK